MRATVKKKSHQYYNRIFIVSYLTCETAAGRVLDSKELIAVPIGDIEIECEEEWEQDILNNKDILDIKKPREASNFMYYVILHSLKDHLNQPIKDIVILEDEETLMKKVWVKRIKLFVNNKPLSLVVTGKKFTNIYDISIADINIEECISNCERQVEKVKIGLNDYNKRLNGLVHTIQLLKKGNKTIVRKPRKKSGA